MLVVGLTGGIGAGKSTVARMLRELGAAVVDADDLAREVVRPGTVGLESIVEAFGAEVLDASGALDRASLGQRVFGSGAQRAKLEGILHPAIAAAFEVRLQDLARSGATIVVYEAALLLETGRHAEMDLVLVVVAEDPVRARRLQDRDGTDLAQVRSRMESQWDQQRKAEVADYVIDNSGDLAVTRRQTVRVWRKIQARGGG